MRAQEGLLLAGLLLICLTLPLVSLTNLGPSQNAGGATSTTTTTATGTSGSAVSKARFSTTAATAAQGSAPRVCEPPSAEQKRLNAIAATRNGARYNEQLWFGLSQNFTTLAYNVTAISQNDSYGFGPAYLLNGFSNKDYWYQVGIAWNWATSASNRVDSGFHMFFEIWNGVTGQSIFPSLGGSGFLNFSRPVASGDTVLLSLNFSFGFVVMDAHDWQTSGEASIGFPSFGATLFLGSQDSSHYPTSLLTEWYHVLPYVCTGKTVTYSNSLVPLRSGWLTINEWNFTGVPRSSWFDSTDANQTLFSLTSGEFTFRGATDRLSISINGTSVYCDEHEFTTV